MKEEFVYYVTDPCYIINNEDWQKICAQSFDEDSSSDMEQKCNKFDDLVTEKLREISGHEEAEACSTGYGDWTNSLLKTTHLDVTILQSDFYADSGEVCFVRETPQLLEYIKNNPDAHTLGYAKISSPMKLFPKFDCADRFWTVLGIYCRLDSLSYNLVATTEPRSEEEE